MTCSCGCGAEIAPEDSRKRAHKFIKGHNSRVCNPNAKPLVELVCKTCHKKYTRNPSRANLGKNTYCSSKCRQLDAKEWSGREKNPNWCGGFNGVQNIRWCPEYSEWRASVFSRDSYLCQKCGAGHSRENPLHAHHKIRFTDSIEFAFDLDNGITLCKNCHKDVHTLRKTGWRPSNQKKSK